MWEGHTSRRQPALMAADSTLAASSRTVSGSCSGSPPTCTTVCTCSKATSRRPSSSIAPTATLQPRPRNAAASSSVATSASSHTRSSPPLRRSGGELRVWLDAEVATDDDAAAFRGLGCKVAVGAMDDEGRLEVAFEQVHTVVHVGGDPLQEPETVLDDAASVLSAAISAGCRRLVWPSHIGAGDPRGNAYLEVCAEVEDLAAAIVSADAMDRGPRRGAPAAADGLQVVVELVGPEVVRLEDLVRIL